MNKKQYKLSDGRIMWEIEYEVFGLHRTSNVTFWAKTITDAIKQFCEWEQDTNGIKWTYNESAIVSIN